MNLERFILGIVSIGLGVLGLTGEAGSKILSGILIAVFVVLFIPPAPKVGGGSSKAKVAQSLLLTLQFASVAWVSVIGSSWLIANWARAEGAHVVSSSAHQLIIDWRNGIRPADGIRPAGLGSDKTLEGSYVVHASDANGTWLVPVDRVLMESVDRSLSSLEPPLSVMGVILFFLSFFLQGLMHSVSIVNIKR